MNIVYLSGGPRHRVLEALIAAGHRIEQAILGDPELWPKIAETVELARRHGVPVRFVRKKDVAGLADALRGKVALSAGFPYILPPQVVHAASVILNVHGAPLPRYGGARTLNWVIANGETESAITVHRIDEGVDTGPILLIEPLALSPFDTGRSLYRRTLEAEPAVVLRALERYMRLGTAAFEAQPELAEHFPDRVPEHSEIDPTRPLVDLIDEIRAADAERFPAYFYYHGQKLCISLWRPDKGDDDADML